MFESALRRAGWMTHGLCSSHYNDWTEDEHGLKTLSNEAVVRMSGE